MPNALEAEDWCALGPERPTPGPKPAQASKRARHEVRLLLDPTPTPPAGSHAAPASSTAARVATMAAAASVAVPQGNLGRAHDGARCGTLDSSSSPVVSHSPGLHSPSHRTALDWAVPAVLAPPPPPVASSAGGDSHSTSSLLAQGAAPSVHVAVVGGSLQQPRKLVRRGRRGKDVALQMPALEGAQVDPTTPGALVAAPSGAEQAAASAGARSPKPHVPHVPGAPSGAPSPVAGTELHAEVSGQPAVGSRTQIRVRRGLRREAVPPHTPCDDGEAGAADSIGVGVTWEETAAGPGAGTVKPVV